MTEFGNSLYTVKNPLTGLHEIKNPPTRLVSPFKKCPEPVQAVKYAHSPKFRLYILSTMFLTVNELLQQIPLCSKTFYRASWSIEFLKNATRNALAEFLPRNTFH